MKKLTTTEKILMGVGAAVLLSAAAYGVVTFVRHRKEAVAVLEIDADTPLEEFDSSAPEAEAVEKPAEGEPEPTQEPVEAADTMA